MITTLNVLSIGPQDTCAFVRDALLLRTRCRLYVASSTWDLSAVSGSDEIDVAVLHRSLSPQQLRNFTAYIRRRWPCAKILLMKPKDERADYAMYDERITSAVSPKIFLAAIERLGARSRQARRPIASTPCSQALTQNGSSRPKVTGAIQRH
jgi:hypothetical protein